MKEETAPAHQNNGVTPNRETKQKNKQTNKRHSMHNYNPIRQAVLFHAILKNITTSSMLTQSLQCLTPAEQLLAASISFEVRLAMISLFSLPSQKEIICSYTPF
jgi:hypothetical protein